MSETAEEYLRLAHRLGKHLDQLVDSYYGPPEIAEQVEAEDPRDPAALAEDAARIREGADNPWIAAQLTALETAARKLAGEEISYQDEIERYYGIPAEWIPEERFEEAHRKLDQALPGTGSLAERYQAWTEGDTLSGEPLARVVESLAAEVRRRTVERFGLPPGESVDWEFVTDEPWAAYNHYLGNLRSRVEVNTDAPLNPTFLVHVVAHETYPGHHTEHAWKEQLLVREQGRIEETLALNGSPQSLVAEGIAELSVEMALGRRGVRGDRRAHGRNRHGLRPGSIPRGEGGQGGPQRRGQRRVDGARGRSAARRGSRLPDALGADVREASRPVAALHLRPAVALVLDHVHRGLPSLQGLRGGRSGALQAPSHGTAHDGGPPLGSRPMAVATEREYLLFINGEPSEASGGEPKELSEPATGEPLAKVAMATEADIDRAVDAARAALDGDWGRTPPTERSRLLHALADALVANRKELAELEVRNVGKALASVKAELNQGIENFRFYASAIASIAGRSNPIGGSLLFYSLKEPVGVAGQIVPWNYPLMMTTWKLAPALAAGCSIVLKPDSQTPLSALRMAELATEVGFPPGSINVVPGPGTTIGSYIVKHPGVDKIAFTGSTETGSQIMRDASDGIKRLTLELGGKSPNIVFADADMADAIPSSAWSIYYSAGQSCEARSRILVEHSAYDDFVAKFSEAANSLKLGDPLEPETQIGSLISPEHRDRVHGYVQTGREEGAEVVAGGEAPDGKGAFYPPTVLAGVNQEMTVAQEEIFGPVVTISPFDDEKDAIRQANAVRYGLMATVWTGDPARGHRIARRIKAGTVGINMPYTAFPGIPFGGYKHSGFGRELGMETLELYLETKSVIVSTSPKPFNPFGL